MHESGYTDVPTRVSQRGVSGMEYVPFSKLPRWRQPAEPSVVHGDAEAVLSRLSENFFQCCITSPPYWGLRDYGNSHQIGAEDHFAAYVARLVAVFRNVRRVLKDDGVLWLNLGDSYTSGNRGYRAPDPKNPVRGMSYRARTPDGLKPKDLVGIPWRVALALQGDGWYLRSDIIWEKPNCMPESVKDRPTRCHEYVFLFSKSPRYYYNAASVREPSGRNRRSVWAIRTEPFPGAHFATFPPRLVEPCLLATSRVGDWVLDPFFGSGTVGVVSEEHARRYVGVEIHRPYVDLAMERIRRTERRILGPRPSTMMGP